MFRARYVVICIVLNRPIADKSTNKSWTDIPIGTGPLLAGLESHLLGTGNTFKPSVGVKMCIRPASDSISSEFVG